MIGVVLVTHGGLAGEFRAALEHVVGHQEQIATIAIGPDDDMEHQRAEILAAIKRVDTGSGVALLTDMFGGTPSNLAISVMDEAHVEVIAGINLPMLIKLATIRNEIPLADAINQAKEAGRKYISVASQVLSGH
jgi:mannose PTS system EIIA component